MDLLMKTGFDFTVVCDEDTRVLIKMTGDEDFFYIIQSEKYVSDEEEYELISDIKNKMKARNIISMRKPAM